MKFADKCPSEIMKINAENLFFLNWMIYNPSCLEQFSMYREIYRNSRIVPVAPSSGQNTFDIHLKAFIKIGTFLLNTSHLYFDIYKKNELTSNDRRRFAGAPRHRQMALAAAGVVVAVESTAAEVVSTKDSNDLPYKSVELTDLSVASAAAALAAADDVAAVGQLSYAVVAVVCHWLSAGLAAHQQQVFGPLETAELPFLPVAAADSSTAAAALDPIVAVAAAAV